MDELDGRFDVPGQSVKRHAGWAVAALLGIGTLLFGGAACGSASPAVGAASATTNGTGSAGGTGSTVGAGSVADTSHPAPGGSASVPLLAPKATCPLSAATVSGIVGSRVYEESAGPSGSCAFDSTAGGRGLTPTEIRIVILVGPNDLGSLYTFFSQQVTHGLPSCQPYRLLRPTGLGTGAFETACGATPTSGPSSADEYLPLLGGRQLTVTVNRGVGVPDHQLVACETELAAVTAQIRTSW